MKTYISIGLLFLGISYSSAGLFGFGGNGGLFGGGSSGGSAPDVSVSGKVTVGGSGQQGAGSGAGAGASSGGLFNFPGLQLPQLPGVQNILPNLPAPQLPSVPGLPNFGNLPILPVPGLPAMPGLPNLQSLINLPQIPSFPDMMKMLGIPTPNDIINAVRGFHVPFLPSIGEIFDTFSNPINALKALPQLGGLLQNATAQGVENAMKTLGDSVNNAAATAQGNVDAAVKNIQDVAEQTKKNVDGVIGNAVKAIQDTINQQPANVQSCVAKKGSPADTVLGAAKDTVVKCVMDQVSKAQGLGEKVKGQIGTAVANAGQVRDSLSQCGIDIHASLVDLPVVQLSQASCYANSLLKVQADTLLLPVNLAQDAATAVSQISGLKGAAIKCQADLMANVTKAGVTSTMNLVSCMANPNA